MSNLEKVAIAILLAVVVAGPAAAGVSGPALKGAPEGVPTADITFEPTSAAHPTCPPFGACPPAPQITDEYLAFGVDFTPFGGNPPVGVFTDPPDKFGGVSGGILDLLTPTCGRIVSPGSTTQGTSTTSTPTRISTPSPRPSWILPPGCRSSAR